MKLLPHRRESLLATVRLQPQESVVVPDDERRARLFRPMSTLAWRGNLGVWGRRETMVLFSCVRCCIGFHSDATHWFRRPAGRDLGFTKRPSGVLYF